MSESTSAVNTDAKKMDKLEKRCAALGIVLEGSTVIRSENKMLTDLSVPRGVTELDFEAFVSMTELKSLRLPDTLKKIGDGAFCSCEKLETVSIPASVEVIDDGAFSFCPELERVNIGAGLKSLGAEAFYSCDNLTRLTFSPECDPENIGDSPFYHCPIRSAVLPASVAPYIANEKLESVKITRGEYIDEYCFPECRALSRVVIPASVRAIGKCAFADCEYLTEVVYYGSREDFSKIKIEEGNEPLFSAKIRFNA